MKDTLLPLLIIVLWGLGSYFAKLGTLKEHGAPSVYIFEGIGAFIVVLLAFSFWLLKRESFVTSGFPFSGWGLLMGLTWGLGTLLFVFALEQDKLATIVPLTALYPAVTLVFAIFLLGEKPEPKEWIGILLACMAIPLLTGKN